jgi:hypothetical protein
MCEAIILHFVHFWHLTAKTQVRSHVSPCEVCGRQVYTSTGLRLSTSVIPCQYHKVSVPYSSSFQYEVYEKDKRAKAGTFQRKQCSWINHPSVSWNTFIIYLRVKPI